jgi:two-component system chemotaxis response regulator CheB
MAILTQRALQPGERIRVLVVDDSVVIRSLVTHALEQDPLLQIVGTASNGAIALKRIPQLNPDVITLDIEMPEMDGLETLRHLHRDYPATRVVMFSTLTERGVAVTLEALSLGADDYVTKASNEGSLERSLERLRGELVPKIRQFFYINGDKDKADPKPPALTAKTFGAQAPASVLRPPPKLKMRPRALLIGVSTGGPNALSAILPSLPAHFPLPVLVVQHMPPLFTRLLSERLNDTCRMPVAEATEGELVRPGKLLIAPGDFHMKLVPGADGVRISLDQAPPLNSCRPAVDALFSSAVEAYSGAVIAVVLTGMGQDGLRGAEILKARGAYILAQDKETSVVWGMPGAVASAGLADRILPLDQVIPEILNAVGVA